VKELFPIINCPMIYAGLPVLDAATMDRDFNGKIIHVLEFGLGDTVNAIPIIKGTKKAFSKAKLIVYCEKRWLEIVRPYLSKEDELIGWDAILESYDHIFAGLKLSGANGALVPHMMRFSTQLAHGESKQEALVRGLNLKFFVPEIRPEMKISDQHKITAEQLLLKKNLVKNEFVVITPNKSRKSEKFWKTDLFEELACLITRDLGLQIVLLGEGKDVDLDIPGAIKFSDLNIFEAGLVISQSAFFIGLDSGLSHVSAIFDTPSLILYPYLSQDVTPFEVRVHSPFSFSIMAHLHAQEILPKDVLNGIMILKNSGKLRSQSFCPACGRVMCYLDKISSIKLVRRCVCGTGITILKEKDQTSSYEIPSADCLQNQEAPDDLFLPGTLHEMISFLGTVKGRKHFSISGIETQDMKSHRSEDRRNYLGHPDDLDFSIDGVLFCLFQLGYVPQKIIRCDLIKQDESLKIEFTLVGSLNNQKKMTFFWKGKNLTLPDWRWYLRYFSWEFWGSEKTLDQLPKKVAECDGASIAFEVALAIVRRNPSMKSFKYLVRYFMRGKLKASG